MQDPNNTLTTDNNKRRSSRNKTQHDRRTILTQEQLQMLRSLHEMGFGTRKIAAKLGVGRKVVRSTLARLGLFKPTTPSSKFESASKLDPFRERIREKVSKKLTTTRILREIRKEGYRGGRTILADYVRQIRVEPTVKKRVWRRFETPVAQETQYDWSPYRVMLGGRLCTVHAFAATLGFSRKTHIRFYRNERLPILLEAHTHAFADFGGTTKRGVYDWMSTVVLGTIGKDRQPLWNPRFIEFTDHYGYEPYLCKVGDPDRKGKDERIFWYMERDFLLGSVFNSLEHLNAEVRLWLDEVANCRVHGTTREIPDELWQQERPFLISLPDSPYPACSEEAREVGPDSVVWINGTPYTAPAQVANRNVSVRLYSEHFEVLDPRGVVVWSRRYVPESQKGKLVIDPNHYEGVRRRTPVYGGSVAQLEDSFITRFPTLTPLVDGIKKRMKSLAHVHLRALCKLAHRYDEKSFRDAAERVQAFRRYDAQAVRRVLERDFPTPDDEPEQLPLTAAARVLVEFGEVDSGSLDDYAFLDSQTDDAAKAVDDDNEEHPPSTQSEHSDTDEGHHGA